MDPVRLSPRGAAALIVRSATATLDGGGTAEVDIRVPATSRSSGGPLELTIRAPGVDLSGEHILWLVTTTAGWAHFRGIGRLDDASIVPFRCDVYASGVEGGDGSDLIALRVYDVGADPEWDGPVIKLNGSLPGGSVHLDA